MIHKTQVKCLGTLYAKFNIQSEKKYKKSIKEIFEKIENINKDIIENGIEIFLKIKKELTFYEIVEINGKIGIMEYNSILSGTLKQYIIFIEKEKIYPTKLRIEIKY